MTRRSDAGDVLQWRLTPPQIELNDGLVPFLIDWRSTPHPTSRDLPRTRLASWTAIRQIAQRVIDSFHTCPIPEVARLGRTLRAWKAQVLAYFDTSGVFNGGTEAINLIIEKVRRPDLAHVWPFWS